MKKILVRLLIIFIIVGILSLGAYFGYNFYLETQNLEFQDKFYNYIFQNNFKNIFDYSIEENIFSKLQQGGYNSKTEIEFSNSLFDDNNFEIDKLTVNLNNKNNKNNNTTNLDFNYTENELFSIDILSNPKYFAIKNNDVLNNYIGIQKQKTKNILTKINPELKKLYKNVEDFKLENTIRLNENNIKQKNYNDYIENIKKYINVKNFSNDGIVIIEQNGEKIETNAYSLTITKEDFLKVYSVIAQMIIDDNDIKNAIITTNEISNENVEDFSSNIDINNVIVENKDEIYSIRGESEDNTNDNVNKEDYSKDSIENNHTVLQKLTDLSKNVNSKIDEIGQYKILFNGIKYIIALSTNLGINVDEDTLKKDLDELFSNLNQIIDEKIGEDENIKFITYVCDNKTVKTSAFLGDNIEINIDYINQGNSKFITDFMISEKIEDKYNGYNISFSKNKTSAIDNNSIEIDIIKDSNIVSKLEFKFNIEGSSNSSKYNNNLSFLYSSSEGKFSSNITNNLTFGNFDVEMINDHNTLLLDNLDDENFYFTINKLNSKIDSVYQEKLSKLNLINANVTDRIIQNNEPEEVIEDDQEKNHLIDLLVDKISNELGQAEQEGYEYTIQDLKDLEIEGYNIQVSVSEDIAIIKINNYTFKIDKDFNLSE